MKIRYKIVVFLFVFCSLSKSQRVVSPESRVFSNTKNSVCTIYGKAGHGSGFVYNKKGLILRRNYEIIDLIRKQLNDKDHLMIKGSNATNLYKISNFLKRKHKYVL